MPSKDTRRDENPEGFGNIGDFWSRYDRLASKHDKDMLARMNANLDVLLIFVSTKRFLGGLGHITHDVWIGRSFLCRQHRVHRRHDGTAST